MRKITGYIQTYSAAAREKIIQAGRKILLPDGIAYIANEIFSCVDEIIKNAVKANYKFVLVRDRMYADIAARDPSLSAAEIENELGGILKVQESYDFLAEQILRSGDISRRVRTILDEEAVLLKIKHICAAEKRTFSGTENLMLSKLTNLNDMRRRMKETGVKIMLKVQSDGDFAYIEITNTAPILTRDLNRIYHKRDEHRRYRAEGREYEFFTENLDTSDSGFGLGYAKIDAILNSWGLDTERAVTIISSINTTVLITLPVSELRERGDKK